MAQLNTIDNNTEILELEQMEIEKIYFDRISTLSSKRKDHIIFTLLKMLKRWKSGTDFHNMVEELLRESNVK